MFSSTHKRYYITHLKSLALVTFGTQFYILCLIKTDHALLVWRKNVKVPDVIVAQWISVLDNVIW